MKTSEYKTSGILEAYLLGLVSDAEKREVEQVLVAHPELALYLEEVGMRLESQFMQGVVPPPPSVRELIESQTEPWDVERHAGTHGRNERRRATESAAEREYVDVRVSNTHIQVHKYWRTAFIAVFILSKIFLAFGLYYYFKAQSQEQEIERLNKQIQQTTAVGNG